MTDLFLLQEVPVIVTGLKLISDAFSVQLPEYQPLLVLHDPPGGDSVASYTNQKYTSTIAATHANVWISSFEPLYLCLI